MKALRAYRRRAGEQGQSTTEFILTMILFVGFMFFFMKLSYFLAYGNFVQYATFLAARAYQSAGPDPADQAERARVTIVRLLKKSEGETGTERFKGIAQGTGGGNPTGAQIGPGPGYEPTNDANSWLQGVRYTFRSRLFVSLFGSKPNASVTDRQEPGSVTLTSESWLGREPTASECAEEMRRLKGEVDNGC
jgi:hypothetical protein